MNSSGTVHLKIYSENQEKQIDAGFEGKSRVQTETKTFEMWFTLKGACCLDTGACHLPPLSPTPNWD